MQYDILKNINLRWTCIFDLIDLKQNTMTAEKLAAEISWLLMCSSDIEKWELPIITTSQGQVLFNSIVEVQKEWKNNSMYFLFSSLQHFNFTIVWFSLFIAGEFIQDTFKTVHCENETIVYSLPK